MSCAVKMEVLTVSSIIGPIGFAIAKARDMMPVISRKGRAWMARRRRLSECEVCNVMVIRGCDGVKIVG